MEEWVKINDAAKILGISRSTVYRYSESGKLPIYKRVGKSMIKREDIEKLLADIKPLHSKKED